MKNKRLLLAIFAILMSTGLLYAYEDYLPNDRYGFVNVFKIDNKWEFQSGSLDEDNTDPLYGCAFSPFPGVISWSMMTWNEQTGTTNDHEMLWAKVYLCDGENSSNRILLASFYTEGYSDDDGWDLLGSIDSDSRVSTTRRAGRLYDDYRQGSAYLYFETTYNDEIRNFIKQAQTYGDGLYIRTEVRWDQYGNSNYQTINREYLVQPEDRQLIIPPSPSVSNVAWEVNNGNTCVSFNHGLQSNQNRQLGVSENGGSTVFSSFTPGSKSYCFPTSSSQRSLDSYYDILDRYGAFTYTALTKQTYTYYMNVLGTQIPYSTTDVNSDRVTFYSPQFAQALQPSVSSNDDGTVDVRWTTKTTNTSQPYDNSPFILECATNPAMTANLETCTIPFNPNTTSYLVTDAFPNRQQGNVTFYYRIHREHASVSDLSRSFNAAVNTDYATLESFAASIDHTNNKVNLNWSFNPGIRNDELMLRISYGNEVIEVSSTAATSRNGITISECVETSFHAQLYANGTLYSTEKISVVTLPHANPGVIDTLTASAGYFNDHVNLRWKINSQYPHFSTFQVVRSEYNSSIPSEESMTTVNFQPGVLDYSYVDNSCVPGVYYEYKVIGWTDCNGSVSRSSERSAIGFAQPYGVISGQITYSGNQAVRDAAVLAQGTGQYAGRSLSLMGSRQPRLDIPAEYVRQMLTGNSGTIEFFVRVADANARNPLVNFSGLFSLVSENGNYKLSISNTNQMPRIINSTLSSGKFVHLALTYSIVDDRYRVKLYENGINIATMSASAGDSNAAISFGNDGSSYMTGNLDEIRIWNTERSESDIMHYKDAYLSGSEQGLSAYYRCDDEVSRMIFDLSKTGNNFNSRHITISNIVIDELNIPSANQLGLKTYTNENGHYLFNNIPYSSQGTLYDVIPMLGIHEFSPTSRPLFFNASANTHNSIDFEDVSSFPVSGKVTFYNTNYPVKGCQFYIDGTTLCMRDGKPVESDENGDYSIDVPIGSHYITIKNGDHVFAAGGRYPADPYNAGTTHEFLNEITNLTFRDSTFVLLTGRVAGGADEADKPHGFGKGKATIGQARITLATRGDLYNLNLDEDNGRTFIMPADSLYGSCNSVAMTGRAYQNLAHYITILTDPQTGEFNAMLPPIDYQVKDVELVNNDGNILFSLSSISDIPFGSQDVNNTIADSVGDDVFRYSHALDIIHYNTPRLIVRQNTDNAALGLKEYLYEDNVTGFKDTIPLYTVNPQGEVTYLFGYPCFRKDDVHTWRVQAYETYVNYDNQQKPDTTLQPFRYGVVNVASNFGKQLKNANALMDTTLSISDTEFVYASGNEMLLDSMGTTYYTFKVGDPNVLPPYTSAVTINYQDKDRTRYYEWDRNEESEVIVLGDKIIGTNFVTKGPDEVFYILRDPVGADSYAEWEAGEKSVISRKTSQKIMSSESTTAYVITGHQTMAVSAPLGMGMLNDIDITNKIGPSESYEGSSEKQDICTWTFTNSEKVSTGTDRELVGSRGDVFIGTGTNRLYGNARQIYIKRDTAGNYSIDGREALSVTTEFTTQFNYSQYYLLKYMLPNTKKLRNQLLRQVAVSEYDTSYVNMTDSAIYITTLSPDDENFGTDDTYLMIEPYGWKTNPADRRIFEDEVYNYNNQIRRWLDLLAHNEHCKVIVHNSTQSFDRDKWAEAVFDADYTEFDKIKGPNIDTTGYSLLDSIVAKYQGGWLINNYSIGGDVSLSRSETRSYANEGLGLTVTDGFKAGLKTDLTTTICKVGVKFESEIMAGSSWTKSSNEGVTSTSTVSFNASVSIEEALSFDVYQSPDGFGPIFSTRGGQTYCPYHKQEMTQFYEPGQHELHTATIPVSEPRITVQNPVATNVPVGKKAIFNVELANTATPYVRTMFLLRQLGYTNSNGAVLKADGMYLTSTGLNYRLHGGTSATKVIELTQTREDVLDYDSIAVVFSTNCFVFDADTIWLSAHFVQTCSDIALHVDRNVLNNTTGDAVRFTIDGFEQDFRNLTGIQLQYQSEGDDQWHLLKQFPADSAATINYNFQFTKPSYPDGTYRFRAVTLCQFGEETINNESEISTIVVDMSAPEALGQPYPLDGIYTANNQVYVDFNEAIQTGRVLSDNVLVNGVLNAHQVDHEVALNLENNTAVSNATYKLGSEPFTLEMWINYSAPGTIFSYAGGGTNGMEFSIDADNKLVATINGVQHVSTNALIPDKWLYLVLQHNAANGTLNVSYAYDSQSVDLITEEPIQPAADNGNIRFGGNGLNAKMHDVVLWKSLRTLAVSLSERSESKTPYTPDIISLWQMDEGKGLIVNDRIRQRHLTLTDDAWAYNHVNYALHVAAGETAMIDISECPIMPGKSYLFEMWFRANGVAELFHLADNSFAVSINDGNLILDNHALPIRNYKDNAWHHLAIINSKISTPVIAIDGAQLPSMTISSLPPFASSHIVLGNASNSNDIDIDEIRLWNINTTLAATRLQSSNCLKGNEPGLLAYYPMESYVTDPISSQISTEFLLTDKTGSGKSITHTEMATAQSLSAPALVESRPLEYVAHTNTVSNDRIVVNITESAARIEGCHLEITVKDIVDANGNYSEPVRWTVFVNRNQLLWDNDSYTIVKDEVADTAITLTIVNNSSAMQNWHINNVPACMTLSETSGYIQPLQTKNITCTIDATANRGENEYTLYLSGNENMDCPLYITTKVYANKPDWIINPADFENSMNIIACAEVNGMETNDSEDMVAAFVDGELAGVANLKLLPAMGRYYILMTIFHNGTTASTPGKLTFRYWDASTGMTYSNARIYQTTDGTNFTEVEGLMYQENVVLGSVVCPMRLIVGNVVEQTVGVNNGWNWISFNVEPQPASFTSILNPYLNDFTIIKGQNGYGMPDVSDGKVKGTIANMYCSKGYKINANKMFDIYLSGFPVSLDTVITMTGNRRWTWFGYLPQKAMTTNAAMSNINPTVGDIVKSQTQFATWDGYQWVGSLNVMQPGLGYIYYNVGDNDIRFTYPDYADVPYFLPAMNTMALNYFNPIDPGLYQGNMSVTAIVKYNGEEVTTAEIGIFADDECRGAATCDDGFYFITVAGESVTPLTIKVVYNDSVYTLKGEFNYQNDAVIGTIAEPFTIDLNKGTVPGSSDDHGEDELSVVSVEAVSGNKVEKVLIDNEVFIIRDGKMYDTLGRRRK